MKNTFLFFLSLGLAMEPALMFKNKALVMNAGKFYYNFRMENNFFMINQMLKQGGFDSKDVQGEK
jgi:glycosylphosphatidylinositol transamidase (GPIT) subunit GPI8